MLLLRGAYTQPRPFLLFVFQCGEDVECAWEAGRGHSRGR